jgi:hypothetical protein
MIATTRLPHGVLRACSRSGALATGLLVWLTASAQPQTQETVVLVHGLAFGASSLSTLANYVASGFNVDTLRPSLRWWETYEAQSDELEAVLAGRSAAVSLSYSNGGVVTRRYLSLRGSAARLNRHLSINSPHRGAMLAYAVRHGVLNEWVDWVLSSVIEPFRIFFGLDPEFAQDPEVGLWYSFASELVADYFNRADPGSASLDKFAFYLGFDLALPVVGQLEPGSLTFQTLNSSSALQAEAAITTSAGRVSIATRTNPSLLPWSLGFASRSDAASVRTALRYVEAFALAMYIYYSGSPDLLQQAYADEWLNMFWVLELIPVVWSNMTGSLLYFEWSPFDLYYFAVAEQSDGLLPWSTQDYPGGTQTIRIALRDITHGEARSYSEVLGAADPVLGDRFLLPRRSDPPPPPQPLSVSITGPTTVTIGTSYTWTGSASGGSGAYTFSWYRSEAGGAFGFVQSGASYTSVFRGCDGGALRLDVTASNGSAGSQTLTITTVQSGGVECIEG